MRGVPVSLYTLRAAYLVMAAGLAVYIWPAVIHHTNDFAVAQGVRVALRAGLGATAALGPRYPVQMLPVLLFEMVWKAIYLTAFALPLWSAHQISAAVAEDIKAVLMVVIFIPLIPWRYVFAHYVLKHGDRWKQTVAIIMAAAPPSIKSHIGSELCSCFCDLRLIPTPEFREYDTLVLPLRQFVSNQLKSNGLAWNSAPCFRNSG